MARFARGDGSAFAEIVSAHQGRISRLVYRLLGWRDEADDVVQEVFLAALKNLRRFRGRSSLSTWLTRIAINKCRTHRRRRFLRERLFRAAGDEAGLVRVGPADRAHMAGETFERVRRAVARLPGRYREVVVLRYLEEMPVEQITRTLGLSRNAVEVRLHRARQRLRAALAGLIEE